jgi:hypothetical protein
MIYKNKGVRATSTDGRIRVSFRVHKTFDIFRKRTSRYFRRYYYLHREFEVREERGEGERKVNFLLFRIDFAVQNIIFELLKMDTKEILAPEYLIAM